MLLVSSLTKYNTWHAARHHAVFISLDVKTFKYNLLWLTILDQEASVYDMNKNTQSYNNIQSIKNSIHQN